MSRISFVPLTSNHFALLHKWMQEPHVWQWWGEERSWSFDDIKNKYTSYTLGYKIQGGKKKKIFPFIITFENQPIGYIQFYNAYEFPRKGFDVKTVWNNEVESLAALDFYIGEPTQLGKGLGHKSLKLFLENLVFKQFDACLVDPEKDNTRAQNSYAKAGFSTLQDLPSNVIMIARKNDALKP